MCVSASVLLARAHEARMAATRQLRWPVEGSKIAQGRATQARKRPKSLKLKACKRPSKGFKAYMRVACLVATNVDDDRHWWPSLVCVCVCARDRRQMSPPINRIEAANRRWQFVANFYSIQLEWPRRDKER